ncbi:VIR protein [Plasmodium vivax]|uniref:VIR protein n=1 Tax=Plasmodium vivax TaxID=5855 RepID=A0A1G4EER0_PLAVI|nr:VIR protein [Plasmodium vivax]
MPETKEDKWILTYEKYHKLKDVFEKKDFDDGLDPDLILNLEKFNNSNKRKFRTVLAELLRHLRNYGIFMTYEEEACRYISYILSRDVQSIVHEYKPETFVMFQEFVNTYNNSPTLTKYTSTNCSSTLVHVHSENYKKMNKLYVLYDAYKKLIAENKFYTDKSCSAVHGFLHEYNEFIRDYQPTNDHFKHILKEFEKEIEINVDIYRKFTCEKDRFYLQEIILQKDKKPKELVQIDQQRINAEYEVPEPRSPPSHEKVQAPHPKVQEPHPKVQTPLVDTRTVHIGPQTGHARTETHYVGSQSFQQTLPYSPQHVVQQEVQGPPREEVNQRESHGDSSEENLPHYGPFKFPGTSSYAELYQHTSVQPSSKEVGDTSSTVMGTITSALRDVEPGPVLVVSGGMGVLFLLFKYTPVGSFFGGRRGRFRQIPRTFGGFPPGDFGNFQEYGGGYVGYSQMDMPFQGE